MAETTEQKTALAAAKLRVAEAKKQLAKAKKTPARGDDAEAKRALESARQWVESARRSADAIKNARQQVELAAQTPDTADDKLAAQALKTALKSDTQLREDIRKQESSTMDDLQASSLQNAYGLTYKLIHSNKELWDLYRVAVAEEWSEQRFMSEIQNSKWFANVGDEYARKAWIARAIGGADWETMRDDARRTIEATAKRIGAQIPDEKTLNNLVDRYINQGWGERSGGLNMMIDYMSKFIGGVVQDDGTTGGIDTMTGDAGTVINQLQQVALANGVTRTNKWYVDAARAIATGTSITDYENEIRSEAASRYPVYAQRILAGENVQDLASGYMATMAKTLELDSSNLSLDDPLMREALGGVANPDGSPANPMNMWDFEKKLRKDPRFQYTRGAQQQASSMAMDLLRLFGFQG